jgi:hypothetical protein
LIRLRPTVRRTAAIPAVLGATLALAAFTYPGGLACAYDDFRDLEEHRSAMARGKIDSAHYDATIVNLADRLALKDQIIAELVEGRTTLADATRQFMAINSSSDATRAAVEDNYRGATYEEKAARNVIEFVKSYLSTAPAPSNTPQRIEGQFRAVFGKEISVK